MKLPNTLSTALALLLPAAFAAAVAYEASQPNQPIPGTEQTYTGVVTDRHMAQVNERSFWDTSRAYILLRLPDGSEQGFWLAEDCSDSDGAVVGTAVLLESAVEEDTQLPIATSITVLADTDIPKR